MSDFLKRIPRRGELVAQTNKSATDIKPYIESALDADEVIEKIEPYKLNGDNKSPTGSHRIDNVRAMDIVLAFDDARGGAIRASGMLEADILQQLNVCLRRRYELDKHHKIIGVNPKRYTLLTHE